MFKGALLGFVVRSGGGCSGGSVSADWLDLKSNPSEDVCVSCFTHQEITGCGWRHPCKNRFQDIKNRDLGLRQQHRERDHSTDRHCEVCTMTRKRNRVAKHFVHEHVHSPVVLRWSHLFLARVSLSAFRSQSATRFFLDLCTPQTLSLNSSHLCVSINWTDLTQCKLAVDAFFSSALRVNMCVIYTLIDLHFCTRP